MPISLFDCAKQEDGHECLRIVSENGAIDGLSIIEGKAVAYLRSVAAVGGWEVAHALIRKHCERALVHGERPKFSVIIGGDVA